MEARVITEEEIRDSAKNLRIFLKLEEIGSVKDLEDRIGQSSPVLIRPGHLITIEIRPSDFGSTAYIVSYITPKKGIPIEVGVNPGMNYSRVILKTESRLKDYDAFAYDVFGNVIQVRTLPDCSLSEIKKELEALGGAD